MAGSGSLDRSVIRGLVALESDRERASPLLAQLREGQRCWNELCAQEQSLLRGAPLIDLVLERSFAVRYDNPDEMVALAETGRLLAESLAVRRYGRKVKADLCARAWTELANAHRVAEDLAASELAFEHAISWAQKGTGSASLRVHIKLRNSALLLNQRRLEEAANLLEQVADYHRREGDGEALVGTLLGRAIVYEEDHEPAKAVGTVVEALEHMTWFSPLRLQAYNALVDNLVGAGLYQLARKLLKRSRRIYRRAGRLNQLRLCWLEARIAFGLGEDRVAEGKLNTARLGFKRVGKNYEAALVGLDLALLLVRQERRQETAWLVSDMLRTFRALGIAREVIASLALLKRSCDGERSVEALSLQIETIAATLTELQRERPRQAGRA
jgi:tetratricopeptide (TPR) repeat protein